MKAILFILVVTAACSASPPKTSTTSPPRDPVPMDEPAHDGSHSAEPTDEAKPKAPDPAAEKAAFLAAETAAFEKAKPVFDKHCARCHTKSGEKSAPKKLDHFDMTTYPFGGHHGMEISSHIRKALGIDGSKPTMPADNKGVVKGDELALIAAWADAFDASHKAGAHEGHGQHQHGGHSGH
jgi:hypothetical protein